jgi:cell division septum initiation protein DivIVA
MQQYKDHATTCITSSYVQSLERKIQDITSQHEREMEALEEEIDELHDEIARHTHTLAMHSQQSNQTHAAEKEQLQNQINTHQSTISSLESRIASMGPTFNKNYGYNQYNVVDLSKIISRNLFDKPNNIDANRIFNCIKQCYDAALHDEDYRLNVNMLLATCYASNWFSYNQRCRILEWFRTIRMYI